MAVSESKSQCGTSRAALGVVVAAPGYPGDYPRGTDISLGQDTEDTKIFHAGTTMRRGPTYHIRWPRTLRYCSGSSVSEAKSKSLRAVKKRAF